MMKKSTVNPSADLIKDVSATKPKPHVTPKINQGADGKRVIHAETKPAGRNSSSSTFNAPRKEGSHDPLTCGYTKPGKM